MLSLLNLKYAGSNCESPIENLFENCLGKA